MTRKRKEEKKVFFCFNIGKGVDNNRWGRTMKINLKDFEKSHKLRKKVIDTKAHTQFLSNLSMNASSMVATYLKFE